MASSRHHRCCHHRPQICHSCCCCGGGGGGGGGCNSCCSDSTPQLTNYDDLVKTLASHNLLLQTPTFQSPPPNLYSFNPYLDPHLSIHQKLPKAESFLHPHQRPQPENAEPLLLHSLLRRVADLESFLPRLSAPPQSHTPPPPPASSLPKRHKHPPSLQHPPPAATAPSSSPSLRTSLRDMAARTIQVAFRRFLVLRSRMLRDLKKLAAIEAHVAALHSAVSDKKSHEPKALSERAMHLLMRLDSIQSGEPMIRHGKRSISRELVRMLEFIDKVLVKEHQRSLEAPELEESAIDRREFIDNLSRGTKANEKIAKVAKKKVSFSANGKSSGFSLDGVEAECGDADEGDAHAHSLGREYSGLQIKDHLVSQSVHQVSDDERSSESSLTENIGVYKNGKHLKDQNGNSGLAAPMPLQMEPRRRPF